ncbi:unnamed protein product, partial [Mycena citricolor]
AQVIEHVSWSTETKLRKNGGWTEWHDSCAELHCVQDADRLDAIGAFGILRCAAYSAAVNRYGTDLTMFFRADAAPISPLHVPSDDSKLKASAIQHFHDKLVLIRDRLKTEPGKKLGAKRHSVIVAFIESVEEEYRPELADL